MSETSMWLARPLAITL